MARHWHCSKSQVPEQPCLSSFSRGGNLEDLLLDSPCHLLASTHCEHRDYQVKYVLMDDFTGKSLECAVFDWRLGRKMWEKVDFGPLAILFGLILAHLWDMVYHALWTPGLYPCGQQEHLDSCFQEFVRH